MIGYLPPGVIRLAAPMPLILGVALHIEQDSAFMEEDIRATDVHPLGEDAVMSLLNLEDPPISGLDLQGYNLDVFLGPRRPLGTIAQVVHALAGACKGGHHPFMLVGSSRRELFLQ